MPSSTAAAAWAERYYARPLTADAHYRVLVGAFAQSARWVAIEAPLTSDLTGERVRWADVRASSEYGSTRAWTEVELEVVDDE